MALHKDFPKDPYAILNPEIRWFPADEDLREKGFEKLIPPLVADLRKRVFEWRQDNYKESGAISAIIRTYDGDLGSGMVIYRHELIDILDKMDKERELL